MGQFINLDKLSRALSPATMLALFDDTQTNIVSAEAVEQVIAEAEAEVKSYLVGFYDNPLPSAAAIDELLRLAAMDFAVCFAFARHPEYALQTGQAQTLEKRQARAEARMLRIQKAVQRPAGLNAEATPTNVGGEVIQPATADDAEPEIVPSMWSDMGSFSR